jgi:hypothetical protein
MNIARLGDAEIAIENGLTVREVDKLVQVDDLFFYYQRHLGI